MLHTLNLEECDAAEQTALVVGSRHRSRWLMLLLFCLVAASNAFMFISLASVSHLASRHYNSSIAAINLVAQAVYLGYVLLVPVSMALYSRLGLRTTVIIAAVLNALGAVLRAVNELNWVTTGSFIVGVSVAFFIGTPTWLSATWFDGEEQSTATAIAVFATQAGLALGFLIPPVVINLENLSTALPRLHFVTALVCVLIAVLVGVLFQADPHGAPSDKASWTLKSLLNRDLLLVTIQFGVSTAIYWTLAVVLSSALHDSYTSSEIGILGSLYLFAGLFGTWGAGVYLDRRSADPPYRAFIATVLAISLALLAAFTWILEKTNQLALTGVVCTALGAVLPSVQPAYLELAVEYSFPELPEEISGSMLYLVAMLGGFLLPFLVEPPAGQERSFLIANVSFTIAVGVCALSAFALSTDFKRKRHRLSKSS